ncbi:MAG: hypothetical protein CVV27_08495 [Candidatus Melainabacteria bacterium HGW-Melainabacteria-1]|nr:MAG: hypothetical protein CVV27_08495 [Candidatus Melainabacteria bacterium HGW-Melainabacteria-1]
MKRVLLVLSLVVFIGALQAEEKNESYSRSMVKFGGSYTVGDVFTLDDFGCGLATMKYEFFDPFVPGGFYFGVGGADIKRTVGGVSVGDVLPVTIGWRKEVAGPLGLDLSFSPVVGSRIVDDVVSGSYYLGAKPLVGAFVAFNDKIDLELAYEPMIRVLDICGSPGGDAIYHDISLSLVLKNFTLTKKLNWYSTAP